MAGLTLDYGFTKKILVLFFFVGAIGLVYILATQYMTQVHKEVIAGPASEPQLHQLQVQQPQVQQPQPHPEDALRYRKQRDDLSRQLNLMKKDYGQQSCEQLKIMQSAGKSVESRVSENGGWCSETSSADSSSHMWDSGFSKALSAFLKGKTVASFGDGPGSYKKHLDSLEEVASYTAYDGAPFCENVTKGLVHFLDLTAPQYGLPSFDWVVSVEVGEHIPAKYEDIYLDNIVRHAKFGIILSWAVPGQSGLSHVNNKNLVDVVAQLNKRGFDIDKSAGDPLRKAAAFAWLKGNVHVYYRIDPKTFVPEDA